MCCMAMGCVLIVLLAVAVGFFVLAKASKLEGNLNKLGKVIGWVIIVVSAVTLIISLYCSLACPGKRYCGYKKGKGMYKKMGMKKHMKGMMDKECWHMKKDKMMEEEK